LANSTINTAFFAESPAERQADLREDVVVHAAQPYARDPAEQTHRHDQNDRRRKRKALILRRVNQPDKKHTQRKNEDCGIARQFFLKRNVRPFEVKSSRQYLR
jgi:hypothetical protein